MPDDDFKQPWSAWAREAASNELPSAPQPRPRLGRRIVGATVVIASIGGCVGAAISALSSTAPSVARGSGPVPTTSTVPPKAPSSTGLHGASSNSGAPISLGGKLALPNVGDDSQANSSRGSDVGGEGGGGISGVVTAMSSAGSAGSITLSEWTGAKMTVRTTSATLYKSGERLSSASSLSIGARVQVVPMSSSTSGDTIAAMVVIHGTPGQDN